MLVNHKMSGFTLLELMVVLTIGAIILTVGVPNFRTVIQNSRLTSATNELVMSLNMARSEAIKRVTYVTVCRSSTGDTCSGDGSSWNDGWILFANANAATPGSVDAGDEVLRINRALHEGINLSPSGLIDGFITFRPTGTIGTSVANLSGTLTMCDDRGAAYARGVLLDPSGRWQVSRELAQDGSALVCP